MCIIYTFARGVKSKENNSFSKGTQKITLQKMKKNEIFARDKMSCRKY
jgi:hypothetical protein